MRIAVCQDLNVQKEDRRTAADVGSPSARKAAAGKGKAAAAARKAPPKKKQRRKQTA